MCHEGGYIFSSDYIFSSEGINLCHEGVNMRHESQCKCML